MTDLERKLYHACLHAYQWHCGTSSEQAEKDCMAVLMEAIEAYNEKVSLKSNPPNHQ